MRKGLLSIVIPVAIAACGGAAGATTAPTTAPPDDSATTVVETTTTSQVEDQRPVWAGFEATQGPAESLVAYTYGPIEVFGEPGDTEPKMTLHPTTILGTVTVLGVVNPPRDDWVEVMLPARPNGSTGWVDASAIDLYVADTKIVIELDQRRLTYYIDDEAVLTTPIGVGSRHNRTPEGEFFVTDSVTLTRPDSPWGPHALGLSARSDSITEYNGGDGIIGIHGTNNPSSIGGNISLGCVRLPNDMITALHEMVPIGTRVLVEA